MLTYKYLFYDLDINIILHGVFHYMARPAELELDVSMIALAISELQH